MNESENGHRSGPEAWDTVDFDGQPAARESDIRRAPPSVRQLLRRYGFKPRKKLGQNFLVEEDILDRIADVADLVPGDQVLEVGPGLGTLTMRLAQRAGHVLAVELDSDLARIVGETTADYPNVTVANEDILHFAVCAHFGPRAFKLVGNLPYYVTSPILRYFLENPCPPSLLVLMLQREVAERILAGPGEMSLLAVSVQLYAEPRLVQLVDAGAFFPPPKVDSAVVRLDLLPRPAVDVNSERFFSVVAAGFSQPRKQLHNTLSQRFWMQPGQASELLHVVGIDPKRRAQTLSLEEWAELTRVFERAGVLKTGEAGGGGEPSAG
ncbi:MAG: 16S rRNA (adenine(1518)-N(6)/adenine(1519)-N(6))-dimethyltransferase RsmA [Chloroflexi bacterium]|nr:16S rRNA (adenine(1518)-N(6)/adenine(1519)-N(6))-dimethyltransferase RsmA [Chloroflexota bacterium]